MGDLLNLSLLELRFSIAPPMTPRSELRNLYKGVITEKGRGILGLTYDSIDPGPLQRSRM